MSGLRPAWHENPRAVLERRVRRMVHGDFLVLHDPLNHLNFPEMRGWVLSRTADWAFLFEGMHPRFRLDAGVLDKDPLAFIQCAAAGERHPGIRPQKGLRKDEMTCLINIHESNRDGQLPMIFRSDINPRFVTLGLVYFVTVKVAGRSADQAYLTYFGDFIAHRVRSYVIETGGKGMF
jgi:hypothetical protein